MEIPMEADEVLSRIKQLQSDGSSVNKKQVKQSDPDLMRSALYFYPSWEHALKNADLL